MKLFVTFNDEEGARFVVLCDPGDTVSNLRRQISGDFRALFPARAPLCFFRMASADGFFLTDSATLGNVLEDGASVLCHRADRETAGAPVPERPSREEVDEIFSTFRAQAAYVVRWACHIATKGGLKAAPEAMSVVLAVLLLEGQPRPEVRLEALLALQRSLLSENGVATSLPTFVAVGGLFVLLHLLSTSTRMDSNAEVLESCSRVLEQLAADHGEVFLQLLQDCDPSSLLQKLSLDSRCGEVVRNRAVGIRRLLEKKCKRSNNLGRRGISEERNDRARLGGAPVTETTVVSSGYQSKPPAVRQGLPAPIGTAALHLSILMDGSSSEAELQQALSDLESLAERSEGLREIACCPQLFSVLFMTLRTAAASSGGSRPSSRSTVYSNSEQPAWKLQLATIGSLYGRLAASVHSKAVLVKNCSDFLFTSSSDGSGRLPPREIVGLVQGAWLRIPEDLRKVLPGLLKAALVHVEISRGVSSSVGINQKRAGLLMALMDPTSPEELQLSALQALREALNDSQKDGHDIAEEGSLLNPKATNAVILRSISQHPLLCIDIMGALALREHFRNFLSSQTSFLQLLAHCCQQPDAVATTRSKGSPQPDPIELQRSAARCLANLSSHASVREWARRSGSLRNTLASAEDLGVRTYLSVALG